jgi:hypothetical protein
MSASELRNDHIDLLMEYVRNSNYPSGELLNRIEGSLRTEEQAERYVELLREKVRVAQIAPSLHLLNRIDRVINRLEVEQMIRERLEVNA